MGNVASTLLKLYSFQKEMRTPLQRLHELEKGVRGRSWELRTPVEAGGRSCVLSMMPTVLPQAQGPGEVGDLCSELEGKERFPGFKLKVGVQCSLPSPGAVGTSVSPLL